MSVRLLCGVPLSLTSAGSERGGFLDGLTETLEPPAFGLHLAEDSQVPAADGTLLFEGPDFEVRERRGFLELVVRDGARPIAWLRLTLGGDAFVVSRRSLSPVERSLRDALLPELIVVHLWPLRGSSYLHAAAAMGPQGARLFIGPSGRGKSTAAALLAAAGEPSCCADRCAVGSTPAWAAAAPWHGGLPHAGARFPLKEIHALSRVGSPRRRALGPAEALAALSASAFLPRWWPAGLEAGLDALLLLARAVPVFELCSEPDHRLVRRVQEAA